MKAQSLYIICLIALLNSFSIKAQENKCSCQDEDYLSLNESKLLAYEYALSPAEVTNQVFFGAWTRGNVLLTNGTIVKNKVLRYNKYNDQLLWIRDADGKIGSIEKSTVAGFTLNYEKDLFAFSKRQVKFWNALDSVELFLQVLSQGKINLYSYESPVKSQTSNEIWFKKFYLIEKDGHIMFIKPRRHSLLKAMGDKANQMKDCIRSEKLFFINELSLKRVIDAYNHAQ